MDNDQNILQIFMHVIEQNASLKHQIAAIKRVAIEQQWGKDNLFEMLNITKAIARKSPKLCQLLLALLVEAAEAVGEKHTEGSIALNAGNMMEALRFGDAALTLQLRAADAFKISGDMKLYAAALANTGNALIRNRGEYSKALKFYQEALPYFRETMEPEHVSNLLKGMGQAYKHLNRYDKAVEMFKKASDMLQATDPCRGELRILIGECMRMSGHTKDAINTHESIVDSNRSSSRNLIALLALANDYLHAGRWQDALGAYEKLLKEAETAQSIKDQAAALHGMGNCYAELKQFAEAEQHFRKALEMARSVNDARLAAYCLDGLGQALLKRGQKADAQQAVRDAIAMAQKTGDRNNEARLWGNLGIASLATDKNGMKQAVRAFQRGITVAKEIGNAQEITRLTMLLQTARQTSKWVDMIHDGLPPKDEPSTTTVEREKTIEATTAAAEQAGDIRGLQQALSHAGQYFEIEKGQLQQAARYYERAIELHEAFLTNVSTFDFQRAAGGLDVQDYAGMIHACLRIGEVERAWWYVERGRARSLLRMLARDGVTIEIHGEAKPKNKFTQASSDLYRMFEGGHNTATLPHSTTDGISPRGHLNNLIRKRDECLCELRKENQPFTSLRDIAIQPVDTLQSLIPEGVAILEYYLMPELVTRPEMTFVFVITCCNITCIDLKITRAQLYTMVKKFREHLLPPEKPVEGEMKTAQYRQDLASKFSSWENLSRELHSTLIKPVLHLLNGVKALWIIPSGPLHYLPFAALRSDRYLVEQFALSRLPSVNVLRFLKFWEPDKVSSFAAFVNPESNLPGAITEAEVIRLKGQQPQCWSGPEANKLNTREACKAFDIVHLACHASLQPKHPMHSCLLLASTQDEEGKWQLHEIMNQSFRTSMVVLSACNTSYPDVAEGEELLSLSYAFLHAGVSTVVGSLWKVSDDACPVLMESFYKNLEHSHVAEALRQAQLEMIRSEEYAHPTFWAAFNATGISNRVQGGTKEAGQIQDKSKASFDQLKRNGTHALMNGAHGDAIRYLSEALCLKPNDAEAWDFYGVALHAKGDIRQAYKCYHRSLELGRQDETLFCRFGTVCQSLGKLQEAERHYRSALALNSSNTQALTNLAGLLGDQRRFKEALEYADRAVQIDPGLAGAVANKAIALYGLDQIDEAISWSHKALKLDPKSVGTHLNIALALGRKLEISEARRHLLKALKLDHGNKMARLILKRLRSLEHDLGPKPVPGEAAQLMQNAVDAMKQGQSERAVSLAKDVVKLVPHNAAVWCNQGAFLSATGHLEEAKQSLERSVQIDETDPDAWFNLAHVNFQLKRLREAARCVEKSLDIDADFVRAIILRGQLLGMQGRKSEAISSLEKALRLEPNNIRVAKLLAKVRKLTAT